MRAPTARCSFLNLLLLLTVGFLPFPTKLVAQYLNQPGEQAAVYAYDATFVVMSIVYNAWWRYASTGRRLIGENVPDSTVRAITRAFNPGVPMYGFVFLVAVFSPLASVDPDVRDRRVLPAVWCVVHRALKLGLEPRRRLAQLAGVARLDDHLDLRAAGAEARIRADEHAGPALARLVIADAISLSCVR